MHTHNEVSDEVAEASTNTTFKRRWYKDGKDLEGYEPGGTNSVWYLGQHR